MDDKKQPIIIKKIKKGGHAHHGGAWKVAYADFVTAMMAFFLLMWMLGGSSHHVREGIADWFKNPTGVQGPGGASTSVIKLGGAMEIPRSNMQKMAPSKKPERSFKIKEKDSTVEEKPKEIISKAEKQEDKKRLDKLLQQLKLDIETAPALSSFKDQLLLNITPEGLRIQIIDNKNRPMFGAGSAILKTYTKKILRKLGGTIKTVPNHISISGHTDAGQFSSYVYVEYGAFDERRAYSNWELSADRANAARRELINGGMSNQKIGRVAGLADTIMLDKANPHSPANRRISIVVLNKETEAAIGLISNKSKINLKGLKPRLKALKKPGSNR